MSKYFCCYNSYCRFISSLLRIYGHLTVPSAPPVAAKWSSGDTSIAVIPPA